MIELALLLAINLFLAVVVVANWKKSKLDFILLELSKYVFILLIGWLAFSILFGLLVFFDDFEGSKEFSYQLLTSGASTALRWIAIGLVLTFLLTWLPIKFSKQRQNKN